MHLLPSLLTPIYIFLAAAAAAQTGAHLGEALTEIENRSPPAASEAYHEPIAREPLRNRANKKSRFRVNGKKIPEVNFDIGESYAGLLPISNDPKELRQFYFWYFPTADLAGQGDITIWLNGGPGCSSLEGLLQENGPFLWQYGTFQPVPNPYSWTNLTNMIWVDQPIGTGFSQGSPSAESEEDVAEQFLGFFRNFIDTFDLHYRRIYITGESYAGYYIPYIADAMFAAKDAAHFDLQGTMLLDPSVSSEQIQEQIPAAAYATANNNLFALNRTFLGSLTERAERCGYTSYLKRYLTFPPFGPQPPSLQTTSPECNLWGDIFRAVSRVNPCFNIYQIATTCPLLWDVLGYPGSFEYVPAGAKVYFNRADVQHAINAPMEPWYECTPHPVFVKRRDRSEAPSLGVLPRVIDKSTRTIIGHGALDYILIADGTLLAIQNMTFGTPPQLGFQRAPTTDFIVPNHVDSSLATLAGAGVMGTTHTERKLTWVSINLSGHMVPQFAPSAAFRMLEFLLGRIDSLSSDVPFGTVMHSKAYGPNAGGSSPMI